MKKKIFKIEFKEKKKTKYFFLFFYLLKFIRFFFIKSKIFYSDSLSFDKNRRIKNIYNYFILMIVNKLNKKLYSKYDYDKNCRTVIYNLLRKDKINNLKNFENFFYDRVAYDIPCELVEGFKIHINHSIGFPESKNIYTTFLHYNNIDFKIFISKALEKKKKVSIIEHGEVYLEKRTFF